MPDLHANFAYSTVLTAPSTATAGTSLVVQSGNGALFPKVPFNATVWPAGAQPTTANSEIVRVTAISTDTFTITRGATSGGGLNGEPNNQNRAIVVGDQIGAGITVKTLTDSEQLFPAGGAFNFIESGCVWSGDSYGSTLNGSMTAGFCWIAGVRLIVNSITAHAFTASKDTYVDFQNNGDGTASVTYTAAANNAASSALGNSGTTANTIRCAIIVSGASSIAAATSVNQGQETMVLPIASSIAYSVTDSLGNLICPRDPIRKTLGYRQITSNATQTSSATYVTGLTCPVIVPTGRKIKVTAYTSFLSNSVLGDYARMTTWVGATAGTLTTQIAQADVNAQGNGAGIPATPTAVTTLASGLSFLTVALAAVIGGTATIQAGSTDPAFILVELA